MPNYVGSVRVMLVAANEDAAYGKAEKTVPVKKPLMALATLPRVLGPGENLRLPVSIFAMDNKVKNVDVQLVETTGLVNISGGRTKQLRFDSPGEDMVYFNLNVGEAVGIAKFKITATGGGEKANQEIEIDVRNPNPYVTNVYASTLQAGESWDQEVILAGSAGTLANSCSVDENSVQAYAWFAPRGVGPTQWNREERHHTHIRRRFMLLGETLDSMRVFASAREPISVKSGAWLLPRLATWWQEAQLAPCTLKNRSRPRSGSALSSSGRMVAWVAAEPSGASSFGRTATR